MVNEITVSAADDKVRLRVARFLSPDSQWHAGRRLCQRARPSARWQARWCRCGSWSKLTDEAGTSAGYAGEQHTKSPEALLESCFLTAWDKTPPVHGS